jgi:hypothetical protein
MFAHLFCGARESFFAGGRLKTIIMALGERKVCWITKTAPWSGIDLSYKNFLYCELSLMVRSLTLLYAAGEALEIAAIDLAPLGKGRWTKLYLDQKGIPQKIV